MHREEVLWVIWNNKVDNSKYIIGKLYKKGIYSFEYCKDEFLKAKEKGCLGIFSFPDVDRIYISERLFSVFSSRLPNRNREDINEILNDFDMKEYDEFELLKKTRGRVINDNLEFVTDREREKIVKEQLEKHNNSFGGR